MSRRTWMIAVSVVAHLALGAAVFVSGVWKLEMLDADKPSLGVIGVMMLPESSGSPPAAVPKLALEKPQVVAKVLTQIVPRDPTPTKRLTEVATAETGNGSGEGTGEGSGSGSGTGLGGCLVPGACQEQAPVPDPPKPEVTLPTIVPPTTLQALFLSGERKVHPTPATKREMFDAKRMRSVGIVKACLGAAGEVTSVVLVSSTKYADYDARLLAAVRGWKYRPYIAAGRPTPVCGMVTFIYSIE